MHKIVLKGYAPVDETPAERKKHPEIISKELNWPIVPRRGDMIAVGGSGESWEQVEDVLHVFKEKTIEVHFRASRDFLRLCVEYDGFKDEALSS